MDNRDHHVNKTRKIDGLEACIDDSLALSLNLQPLVPTPEPPPMRASTLAPVCRLYSPSPPPPPSSIPDCLQLFPIPAPGSPVPYLPPPPPGIYPHLPAPVSRLLSSAPPLNSPVVLPPQPPPPLPQQQTPNGDALLRVQSRRNPTQLPRGGKSVEIVPPYPWATDRRAMVHNLSRLLSSGIHTITGDVQCKRCERNYEMAFDIRQKLPEIFWFISENKTEMHDRAPAEWMSPSLPPCRFCEEQNCVRPVISDKKRTVNWLFLLLGQMLGYCTLGQLKYFCKHTKNHRTGAKDRVLYLTYLGLCKQLDPDGPFER